MKRILNIGDLHGRMNWKGIDPKLYDKIIFVGDYCDAYGLTDEHIANNLLDVIQFKKDNMNKVELLWGNHELHYLWDEGRYMCSGYRPTMKYIIQPILKDNKDLFECAYEIQTADKKYIWTHAGIAQRWFERYMIYDEDNDEVKHLKHMTNFQLAEQLNMLFYHNRYAPLFYVDPERGGASLQGGPLWLGKNRLIADPLKGYTQIIGHTPCKDDVEVHDIADGNKLIFIDFEPYPFYTLEILDEFYEFV